MKDSEAFYLIQIVFRTVETTMDNNRQINWPPVVNIARGRKTTEKQLSVGVCNTKID